MFPEGTSHVYWDHIIEFQFTKKGTSVIKCMDWNWMNMDF